MMNVCNEKEMSSVLGETCLRYRRVVNDSEEHHLEYN